MLVFVPPVSFTPEDFQLLYYADKAGPRFYSTPMDEIVRRLWDGSFLLYRVKDGKGVFLFEIDTHNGDKRLNILRVAGRSLLLHPQKIAEALQHIARELGCVAIETVVYSERLARALARGGAKQESVTMVLELDDGR